MNTNESVHQQLTTGAVSDEAIALAKDSDPHTLMGKVRALYEKYFGRTGLDNLDWHWQATTLKNHAHNAEHTSSEATSSAIVSETGDPIVSQALPEHAKKNTLSDAPTQQGTDQAVSTSAPGTPTSLGTPTDLEKPASIKPKPDANDPTDASLIKTAPVVTEPGSGGATLVPGSPAAEQAPPKSHKLHTDKDGGEIF